MVINTTIATVTADVVEFKNESYDSIQTGIDQLLQYKTDSTSGNYFPFRPNQLVGLYEKSTIVPVRIISGINTANELFIVEYLDPNMGSTKRVTPNDLYLLSNNDLLPDSKFSIGDMLQTPTRGRSEVIAIGLENIIIRNQFKTFEATPKFLIKD